MPRHKYSAKCSQCGRRFNADSRKDLLELIRKHMWRQHRDWMVRRIKGGLKKRKKNVVTSNHYPGNPFLETVKKIINPSWTGFAERPLIEKVTGRPYQQVREEAIDAFVSQLFSGLTGVL